MIETQYKYLKIVSKYCARVDILSYFPLPDSSSVSQVVSAVSWPNIHTLLDSYLFSEH